MSSSLHSADADQAVQPLSGLLVVAVEQAVAAPLCTARLIDAGARVIKIERPGGDFARGYDNAALGDSSYFVWTNHGKESVELDFKQQEDADLLDRLLANADVFIQNLAPGAMNRAGFGSSDLREKYPRLITCDITGYGNSEAVRGLKAYDLLVQAESGLVAVSGSPGTPGRIGVSLCDIGAGITAYTGILEALIKRSVTNQGSSIAVSLFDVAAEWMSVPLVHTETGEGAPKKVGLRHPSIAPYGAFPSADGTLTLISIQNEREWERLCREVLQQPDLLVDPRFSTNMQRVVERDALEEKISSITSKLSADHFRAALSEASIAYGALNSVDELAKHVALRRRSVTNSTNQHISMPAHPVVVNAGTLDTTAIADSTRVPRVGEHTELVRREFTESTSD